MEQKISDDSNIAIYDVTGRYVARWNVTIYDVTSCVVDGTSFVIVVAKSEMEESQNVT